MREIVRYVVGHFLKRPAEYKYQLIHYEGRLGVSNTFAVQALQALVSGNHQHLRDRK